MKADFYETLGVQKGADEKELKSAFRKPVSYTHLTLPTILRV